MSFKHIATAIVTVIVLVAFFLTFEFTNIKGNELGVKETWSGGVENKVYQPGMQYLFPGWSQEMYVYDVSSQVFTRRGAESYLVQSSEGQDMKISYNLRWRIDPNYLVYLHKTVRKDVPVKLILPVVMRVVKDEATKKKATDSYSGEGLVSLQNAIQRALSGTDDEGKLAHRGVIVEDFVIEHIELDPAYIAEIKGKQVATQRALRSAEEEKAADAAAKVAKAIAQSDLNKQVVEAERAKQVRVKQAEAENESAILAAKAEQQKRVLEAEGQRDADLAKAKGILALGEAEAASTRLKIQAYAVPGSDMYGRIKVAEALSQTFKGVQGFLPSVDSINLLGGNFDDLVNRLSGGKPTQDKK